MKTIHGKKYLFLPLTVLFVLTPMMISAHSNSSVSIGSVVPNFHLKDADGKQVQLSDFKGKMIVLEWTNPNCPFVFRHYSKGWMQALQKKYTDKGVIWLTINSTNPSQTDYVQPQELKDTYTQWEAAFTSLLLDPDGKVGKMFEAKTTPHIFVIDSQMKLAYQGAVDDDPRGNKEQKVSYVSQAVDALVAGETITTTMTRPYGCSVKYAD